MSRDLDRAAAELASSSRRYTEKNLFYAWRRRTGETIDFDGFTEGLLARRLAHGPLPGLLPPSVPWHDARVPRECDAYFPKAVLLVDRPAILDLFVASGVLVTARLAVVCIDGSPSHVVAWLARGFRAGRRAPVAYLHDAATTVYPFVLEPLASTSNSGIAYCDLGLPPRGVAAASLPFANVVPPSEVVVELEALPPGALIAYATRKALAMIPGDPLMAPLARREPAEPDRGGAR
jgi:hypothetical protein